MLKHCEGQIEEGEREQENTRDKDVSVYFGGEMKMCKERKREGV